ncbi:MAG: isoprenylcysteine carboxylmethyltransferase family protein [Rhodobacterales bacterium]|nr:isoprenylcysteine carboxylmethyltransferase family protein [Rhodobacterales bacterium]
MAALLFAASGALVIGAFRRFRQAGTPVKPWQPTTRIVTHGVYGVTRNPMYLAMTLAYGAIAIAAESIGALVFLVPLLIVVTYGVIMREERYLELKFNDEYRRYKQSVPRWI